MRLTLRTMLAYLDGTLESQDAQDLRQKIDESQVAKKLAERIVDVTRRLRLPAPKLEWGGMAPDPNTVAEYLGHALNAQRLLEFEKLCLETDVYLAEVAAAHHVLALVAQQPAEIDAHIRQRMYGLVLFAEEAAADKSNMAAVVKESAAIEFTPVEIVPVAFAAAGSDAVASNAVQPMVAQAAGAATMVSPVQAAAMQTTAVQDTVALASAESFQAAAVPATPEVQTMIAKATVVADDKAVPTDVASAEPRPKPEIPDHLRERSSRPLWKFAAAAAVLIAIGGLFGLWKVLSSDASIDIVAARTGESEPSVSPGNASPTTEDAATTTTTEPPTLRTNTTNAQPVNGQVPTTASSTTTSDAVATVSPALPKTAVESAATAPSPTISPPESNARAATTPIASVTPNVPAPSPTAADNRATTVDAARDGIGRSMSTELMLRFDPRDNTWSRLANQEKLFAGDRLLVLPTDRVNLKLGGNPVTLFDGTVVQLEGPDREGLFGLNVVEGRLVLLAQLTKTRIPLRLRFGDREGILAFGDIDSSVALDVARVRVEGSDPESDPVNTLVDLYVLSGSMSWMAAGSNDPEVIQVGMRRFLDGRPAPAMASPAPAWVAEDDASPLDKRGSSAMKDQLTATQPATVILKEFSDDARPEVNLMALQSLARIDEFDWLVKRLMNPAQRGALLPTPPRLGLIDSLRSALNRGPDVARRLRESLELAYGQKTGGELYRMLWGYTPQQLKEGAAKKLVGFLESDDAAIRTLAFWNLRRITGSAQGYQPFDSPTKRQPSLQRWRQKLEAGQIGAS